jgi:hypothetical protein
MVKSMTKKYLIESSTVRSALGESTPDHMEMFAQATRGGTLWTSVYIRMEYIRRRFCDDAHMAFKFAMCSDVSTALIVLEQSFKPRDVKGALASVALFLRERGAMSNSRHAAEELASLAIRRIERFDDVFPKRINNTCKCEIGGMTPAGLDYNNLLDDLHRFYQSFNAPVQKCEVNAFLGLNKPGGRVQKLVSDERVLKLPLGKKLAKFRNDKTWITCKECAQIGDVVIALEQPGSWCLVHVDNSVNELSRCLKWDHVPLKSISALEKERSDTRSQTMATE